MKVLVDTTYLLPAIGVSVKEVPDDALVKLMNKGYEVYISTVSLFELVAKGAKYVSRGALSAEEVVRGVLALAYDERLKKVSFLDSDALLLSMKLRKLVKDFVDCMLLASAITSCNAFLTEDELLLELRDKDEFRGVIDPWNPGFSILSFKEIWEP